MGNYYEGNMTFVLKKDLPEDLLHELETLSGAKYSRENFKVLENTKWIKHEQYDYPIYDLYVEKEYYVFDICFCMKKYCYDEYDLGQDIYDFLKQYIDESEYDMSDGGYIGRIHDEDDTYDKSFYIDYTAFNKELERRKYMCNNDCDYYRQGVLCDKYEVCERAYCLGKISG